MAPARFSVKENGGKTPAVTFYVAFPPQSGEKRQKNHCLIRATITVMSSLGFSS